MPRPDQSDDAIDKLREWQEHQYNPYYWFNRTRLGYPPNPTKAMWRWSILRACMIIPMFLGALWGFLTRNNVRLIIPVLYLGFASLSAYKRVIGMRPPNKPKSEKPNKQKKKTQPKRRKDYR